MSHPNRKPDQPAKSASRLLLERLYLPRNLQVDVQAWQDQGLGWRHIAAVVSDITGFQVSHETLRVWYRVKPSDAA